MRIHKKMLLLTTIGERGGGGGGSLEYYPNLATSRILLLKKADFRVGNKVKNSLAQSTF